MFAHTNRKLCFTPLKFRSISKWWRPFNILSSREPNRIFCLSSSIFSWACLKFGIISKFLVHVVAFLLLAITICKIRYTFLPLHALHGQVTFTGSSATRGYLKIRLLKYCIDYRRIRRIFVETNIDMIAVFAMAPNVLVHFYLYLIVTKYFIICDPNSL